MAVFVGVHGIAQQQLGRNQLLEVWLPALKDGLEQADSGRSRPDPSLDIAYYGALFLPKSPDGQATKGRGTGPDEWWESLTEEELADLQEAAEEILTEDQLTAVAHEKAYTRVPVFLRAIDKWFPPSSAALFVGELRQVRRYLKDRTLKEGTDEIVRDAITRDDGETPCRVLIGHSLGSVVAFEYVRQNPREFDLLLTLGSPLGLKMVRRLMPDPSYGKADGIPRTLKAWANVRDKHDPVACAGELKQFWPRIDDRPPVRNGGDAHAVTRYLGKATTGSAILQAVPDLRPPP